MLVFQEAQRQAAAHESTNHTLQQTVSGQTAEVGKLTEELAHVTSEKESTEAMLSQARAEVRHNLKAVKTGKENTEQILQTSKAELAQLEKDLGDARAGRSLAEADLKQKKGELKRSRQEVKELQAAKAEAESAAASKLKVRCTAFAHSSVLCWSSCGLWPTNLAESTF